MTSPRTVSSDFLMKDPILKQLPSIELSRMVVYSEWKLVRKGDKIAVEGDLADHVYLIEKGRFVIRRKELKTLRTKHGFIGIEGVLGADRYLETIVALEDSSIITFSTSYIRELIGKNVSIGRLFFNCYVKRHHKLDTVHQEKLESKTSLKREPFPFASVIGWTIGIVLICMFDNFTQFFGVSKNASIFMTVLAVTVVMWVFKLLPTFLPPLLGILVIILFDVVPAKVALKGFSSSTFFMCLSVFGIGALMISSGLTYRLSLYILRILPPTRFWYSFSLFIIGILLTPIVPSVMGRTTISTPFLVDILSMIKFKSKDLTATQLICSAFAGIFLMSPIFLTGHPVNMIVFGLFDIQTQYAFQWASWLYAASIAGIFSLLMFFLLSFVVFRNPNKLSISRQIVSEQMKVLDPMSATEWITLGAVLLMAVGIITSSMHKVEIPWLTLSILAMLMIFGTIGGIDLRSKIDWPTLIFIGAIMAWVPILASTGLDDVIIKNMAWLGKYMKTDLMLFIALMCAIILIVRLFLPSGTTAIIFSAALLPIAVDAGITPWLICFIILMMADTSILPYQRPIFMKIINELEYNNLGKIYDGRRIIIFNVLMIFVRIGAIYASLPFWKYLLVV